MCNEADECSQPTPEKRVCPAVPADVQYPLVTNFVPILFLLSPDLRIGNLWGFVIGIKRDLKVWRGSELWNLVGIQCPNSVRGWKPSLIFSVLFYNIYLFRLWIGNCNLSTLNISLTFFSILNADCQLTVEHGLMMLNELGVEFILKNFT